VLELFPRKLDQRLQHQLPVRILGDQTHAHGARLALAERVIEHESVEISEHPVEPGLRRRNS
jgi:hypothetical protein